MCHFAFFVHVRLKLLKIVLIPNLCTYALSNLSTPLLLVMLLCPGNPSMSVVSRIYIYKVGFF